MGFAITGFSSPKKTVSPQLMTDSLITVPLGGNAWRTDQDTISGSISNNGVVNWGNPQASFTAYIRVGRTGKFKLYLNLTVPGGKSKIAVSALGISKQVVVTGSALTDHYVGEWQVTDTGYVAFKIKGISKTGSVYANISSLKLSGAAIDSKTTYVKNNEGEFFYWGRRGPSVHLGYVVPDGVNAEWFYNEVTVPTGNDVLHSYFMADGFNEGYFGMQVNSATERHILFSVWSPFKTDDPKAIPADQKILMLKKGDNVHTGEFGSEGSGGQSYLNYNWQAGNTYKFIIRAKPNRQGRTEYTAYFYAPELNKWLLIASFSRPKTDTYLKHLHSFLENFEPEQGTIIRKVLFNNQWICTTDGKWIELNKARFTADNTGAKGYRMDYAGGLSGGNFYLQNCGFFSHYTPRNIYFERPLAAKQPQVDLSKLP
ncbi:MAG: hypothetical protein JWP37_2231 [Mucilaginibacter sp.]|nr:hypothetical protein [Mucilaginibacter sp.]